MQYYHYGNEVTAVAHAYLDGRSPSKRKFDVVAFTSRSKRRHRVVSLLTATARLTKHLVAFLEPGYEAKSESLQYYSPAAIDLPSDLQISFSSTVARCQVNIGIPDAQFHVKIGIPMPIFT